MYSSTSNLATSLMSQLKSSCPILVSQKPQRRVREAKQSMPHLPVTQAQKARQQLQAVLRSNQHHFLISSTTAQRRPTCKSSGQHRHRQRRLLSINSHSRAGARAKLLMDRQAAMHSMQLIRDLYQMRQMASKHLAASLLRQWLINMTHKQVPMYKLLQTFRAGLQSTAWAGLHCLRRVGMVL